MLSPLLDEVAGAVTNPSKDVAAVLKGAGSAVHLGRNWPGRAIYVLFAPGSKTPTMVLKVDLFERHKKRLRAEYRNLTLVSSRPSLHESVPAPVALVTSGSKLILAQTGMAGKPLTTVLRRRLRHGTRATAGDFGHFTTWLRQFHAASIPAPPEPLDQDLANDRLARMLPGEGKQWASLLQRAQGSGREYSGLLIPRLWCHGDLGPSNCLMSDRGLSVIDWEGGPTTSNPLADLTLFLNYYSRVMPLSVVRNAQPEKAFEHAFTEDTWLARTIWSTFVAELKAHGLPTEAAHYLMLTTLADMAAGTAGTAHSNLPGFRQAYQRRLGAYARYLIQRRLL
ncbi:aminoglycoside phosphotransferase family protein [Arthrobacter sp. H14]|uniref:aminoglycoside phosphotransferase family protein n=1 Tax=Arthrobacter sp. H14 TaxID=1312959 RepID=UPI00047EE04E|nr:aminoglycoside phosphotransferase family protein [Arthrobacter sp. H14]